MKSAPFSFLIFGSALAGLFGFHVSASAQDLAVSSATGSPAVVSRGETWTTFVTVENLGGAAVTDVELVGQPQGTFANPTISIAQDGGFQCINNVTVFGTSVLCTGSLSAGQQRTVQVRLDTSFTGSVPGMQWSISSSNTPDPDSSNNSLTATVPAYFGCTEAIFRDRNNAFAVLSGRVSPGNTVTATLIHDSYPNTGTPCRFAGPGVLPTSTADGLWRYAGGLLLNPDLFVVSQFTGGNGTPSARNIESVSNAGGGLPQGTSSCGVLFKSSDISRVGGSCNWAGNPDGDFSINASHIVGSDLSLRARLTVDSTFKPGDTWDWFRSCEGTAEITQRACTDAGGGVVDCSSTATTGSTTLTKAITGANICSSATASPVTVQEDGLSVQKVASPSQIAPTDQARFVIDVANAGTVDYTNVVATDTLPSGTTVASVNAPDWSCSGSSGTMTCSLTNALAVGDTSTIELFLNLPAGVASGDTLTNCVSASSTEAFEVSDCASATVLDASADLSVAKTGPTSVSVGETFTYNFTVANAGPASSGDLTLTDVLPAGMTLVNAPAGCGISGQTLTCAGVPLTAGANRSFSISVRAPSQDGSINNCASISSTTNDPNAANNSNCQATTVLPVADLALTKTGPASVDAGSSFNYQIAVQNQGPSAAANVTVTDTLPAGVTFEGATGSGWSCAASGGTVNCSASSLATGAASPITLSVRAPNDGTSLNNCAAVAADTSDPDGSNNSDCHATTGTAVADLALTKTGPASVDAGSSFNYQIAVQNQGPSAAANVTVTDTLPAGVTFEGATGSGWSCAASGGTVNCSASSLATGAASPITLSVRAPNEGTSLNNCAAVAADTSDPDGSNNSDCHATTGTAVADLALTKTASSADVFAGDSLDYSITVEQLGPSTATDVTIDDTLPAGFTMTSIAPDAPFSCTGAVCVASSLPVGTYTITISGTAPETTGEIINAVSASTADPDPDPSNNQDEVSVTISPQADLRVTKQTLTTDIFAADTVDYRLTIDQLGPSPALNVQVVDSLPSGARFISASSATFACIDTPGNVTCSVDTLAPGTYTVDIQIQAPDEGGELINTVSVGSDTHDPEPANNDDSVTNAVTPRSTISIAKQAQDASGNVITEIGAGLPLLYVITVDQQGPSTATNVSVSDTLPAGVSFVSFSASSAFTCDTIDGGLDCLASSLPVGIHSITIEATAPDTSGPIENICVLEQGGIDPISETPTAIPGMVALEATVTGNCSDGGINVTPRADIELTKTLRDSSGAPVTAVRASESVQWAIDVTNNGPSTATNVVVNDDVPSEYTLIDATTSAGSCTVTMNLVSCQMGDLPVGASDTIIINATAPSEPGSFENVCTFESDTPDPVATFCSDGGIEILSVVDLELAKSAAIEVDSNGSPTLVEVTEVGANDPFSYLLRVTNSGPSTAQNVVVTDQLPADVTFVSATGFDNCVEDSGLVTCQISAIPPGDFALARIQVNAPAFATTLSNSADVVTDTAEEGDLPNAASISTAVTEAPAIGLAKAQTMVEDLGAGEFRSSLLFTIVNYGNVPLTDIQLTDSFADAFPAAVNWFIENVTVSGALSELNPAYDGDTDIDILSGAETLPVGGEATVRIDVLFVPDLTPGPFLNQATVTGFSTLGVETADQSTNGLDPNPDNTGPANHSEPTPIQFAEDPALGLAKWVEDRVFLDNGQQRIDLAILVENVGNVALTNVQVIDNLVFTFTPEGQARQRAMAATFPDEDIILKDVVDIRVEGDLSRVNPNYNGVIDTNLLSGIDTLPVDGSATIRFGMIVEPEPDDFGPFFNRALGSGWSPVGTRVEDLSQDGFDVNPSGSGDPTDDNVPTPIWAIRSDVAVSKEQMVISPQPGDTLAWEITATNLGPDLAHQVEITDLLPSNSPLEGIDAGPFSCASSPGVVTCTIDQLPVGATESFTVRTISPTDGANVINTCEAVALTPDPDLTNNACVAETQVAAEASIRMSKTVAGPVYLGQPFDYILTVTNDGPSPATDVLVFDPLPAELQFVDVTSDMPFSCNATNGEVLCQASTLPVGSYQITIGVIAPREPGPITNTCVLESATTNPAEPETDCSVTIEPDDSADITMSKRSEPEVIAPNQTFTWIIEVTNSGPSSAQDVVVVDRVPDAATVLRATADAPFTCAVTGNDVACDASTVPVGVFWIWIEAQAPADPQLLRNTCVLDTSTHTPGALDDCTSVGVIDDTATLVTNVEVSPSSTLVGERFDYAVTVTNLADVSVPSLEVLIEPTGQATLDFVSSNNQCGENPAGEFVCRAVLPATGSPVHIANVAFIGDAPGSHSLTATARAPDMSLTADSQLTDSANVTITAPVIRADMALTLSGPASIQPLESYTYTLNIRNNGPDAAENISLEAALPAGLSITSATGNGWACTSNTVLLECSRSAAMAAGATSSITAAVTASAEIEAPLEACADVSSSTDDPDLLNNGDCHQTDVEPIDGAPPLGPPNDVHAVPVNNPTVLLLLIILMMIGGSLSISRRTGLA